ncbi:hypothetical protein [Priestia megaterium]|uniref:hypothetical protein n=1 Tax=Priestia megaterium TaxID=1404 RepID=UPI000BEC05A7|nr:hypothetical protein [Priestia megaterium]PED64047.1 hypothetical protein CON20_24090 [Priestia megaterium]
MSLSNKVESIVFEKKHVEKLTVTSENIKDYKVLAAVLEQKCEVVTKKSPNRPWLYIKDAETLKTLGGVRLNKNSIGTFYIDTRLGHPLNATMIGVVSKESKKFISNRIIVNDLQSLEKVCELIQSLMDSGAIYNGTRN